VLSRPLKAPRKRGDTVTSGKTTRSRCDSVDTARGENFSKTEESRTPTRLESLERIEDAKDTTTSSTNDSTKATIPDAGQDSLPVPATPALTPALTGTTDDSDTDFQSAYSTSPSPRESFGGSFDDSTAVGDTLHTQDKDKLFPGSFETGVVRERVSSVSTAIIPAQSSPTFSDDTVVSGQERIRVRR
jgi:EEF1A N-terminal glycine/lysine methyltransferase